MVFSFVDVGSSVSLLVSGLVEYVLFQISANAFALRFVCSLHLHTCRTHTIQFVVYLVYL